ncbi:MAG: tetratricopeptide repeat protein [Pseudomonadota bacterium]
MLNSIPKHRRLVGVMVASLWLGACAGTGPVAKKTAPLSESVDPTSTLYSDQKPAAPDAADVIALLEKQVASAPGQAEGYLRLGVAYRHIEQFDLAAQMFEQAAALSETPFVARNELGILHRVKGEFKEAEAVYQRILADAPDFHDAHFNLGILYDLYLRQPRAAQKHYQAYIQAAPEADERVEKWLVDLERRHQIDASASAGVVGD